MLAIAAAFSAPVQAHDLYRGESRIVIQGREVRDTLTLNLLDFPGVDQNGDKVVTKAKNSTSRWNESTRSSGSTIFCAATGRRCV